MGWARRIPWVFIGLAAGPLVLGLGYALGYSLGLTGALGRGFTTEHWGRVLADGTFWAALGFSAAVAVVTMAIGVGLALGFMLRWGGRTLWGARTYAFYLPLAIPATVMAFVVFQWLGAAGLLSRVAYRLGWTASTTDFPALINDRFGVGIVVAHVLMATPFLTIFFANLYRNEGVDRLRGVAATLGLPPGRMGRKLVVPILLARARATLLLYTIFVFSSYEIPLLLGSQSPAMLSVLTIRKLRKYNLADIPQAYTMSVIYALLLVGLLLVWGAWRRWRCPKMMGV